MLTFTDASLRAQLRSSLGQNADSTAFLPFPDLEQSVADDVALVKDSALVLDVPVTGYIYDVKTGAIHRV